MSDVFEDWPVAFAPPPYRRVDPPIPVRVDLGVVLCAGQGSSVRADQLPMRVKSEGLSIEEVDGLLSAWARTSSGLWLGRVAATVYTANRRGRLEIDQWCPAAALKPSS